MENSRPMPEEARAQLALLADWKRNPWWKWVTDNLDTEVKQIESTIKLVCPVDFASFLDREQSIGQAHGMERLLALVNAKEQELKDVTLKGSENA